MWIYIVLGFYTLLILAELWICKIRKRVYGANSWSSHYDHTDLHYYPRLLEEYPENQTDWKYWKNEYNFEWQFKLIHIVRILTAISVICDFIYYGELVIKWLWTRESYFEFNGKKIHRS